MAYIPPEKVEEVQHAIDIVDVVSQYVPLKKSGRNFKACCPFHDEKTPSFMVNPEKQIYHCFGCKEGGNVFGFLMAHDNMTFPEAVQNLADRAGIVLDLHPTSHSSGVSVQDLYKINETACSYFEKNLYNKEHKYALQYLLDRKITEESIKKFRLGLAPPGWENILNHGSDQGVSEKLLSEAGLVSFSERKKKYYDRFRSRIMFPIFDGQDRIVGFGGRALNTDDPKCPKYLNTPETRLFTKGHLLYGLNLAKDAFQKGERVAIMEGYTDVIMAHQFGFSWTVATLGTAFTEHHARIMRRYAKDVYLVFDSDEAGTQASLRSFGPLLDEGLNIKITLLEKGSDPCDFLLNQGKKAFAKRLEGAQNFLDFYIDHLQTGDESETVPGKARAAEELLEVVKVVKDPLIRDAMVQQIASAFGLGERAIYAKLKQKKEKSRYRQERRAPEPPSSRREPTRPKKKPIKPSALERYVIEAFINQPELIPQIKDSFPEEIFVYPQFQQIAQLLYTAVEEAEDHIDPMKVIQEPELQKIVAIMSVDESGYKKKYHLEALTDCVYKIKLQEVEKNIKETNSDRREAEKQGDHDKVIELMQEYTNLRMEKEKLLTDRKGLSFK